MVPYILVDLGCFVLQSVTLIPKPLMRDFLSSFQNRVNRTHPIFPCARHDRILRVDRTPFCCSDLISRYSLVLELSQVALHIVARDFTKARRQWQRQQKCHLEITYPRYPIYFGTIPIRSTYINVNELSRNMISRNGVQVQKEKKIHCRVPMLSLKLQICSFHIVVFYRGRQINI